MYFHCLSETSKIQNGTLFIYVKFTLFMNIAVKYVTLFGILDVLS
jgi:hypothetical protein